VTTKAVIDIALDDSKFTRFKELFDRYQKSLASTPGLWQEATKESTAMSAQFERQAAALMAQHDTAREFKDADEDRLKRLTTTEKLWTSIGKSSSFFAKNILDAGSSLLKWGGLLAGGLIGGSLYGLDRLGAAAADQRRSSLGLGMSTGEQSAFNTDFSRFIDTDSFLHGINEAKSDVSKQGPLWSLGVNPNQSTAQLALATMDRMRALAQATPENMLGTVLSSRHLDFMNLESFKRLRDASPQEYARQRSRYGSDVRALGIDDRTGQAWQDFTTQMERAGQTIFKVLVTRLEPLAPSLEKLSGAVVHVIERFADGGAVETAIKDLSRYLDQFTGVIGKPEFLQKIETFASDMGTLGDIVHGVADAAAHPGQALGKAVMADLTSGQKARWEGIKMLGSGIASGARSGWDWVMNSGQSSTLSNLDKSHGLPAGMLEFIYAKESSFGTNPHMNDKDRLAQGPFQIMPGQAPGVDRHSFDASVNWAAGRLEEELKRYNDPVKAVAAYNIGDGALDKLIAKFGQAWAAHVPYVQGVKIENATGGNIVTSAAQLTQ
jgi:Transglycosylase SLT domain